MFTARIALLLVALSVLEMGGDGVSFAQVVPASVLTKSNSVSDAGSQAISHAQPELRPPHRFTVVNRIYEEGVKQPVAEHRLVIEGGVVYDFDQREESQIVIFDPVRESVTLINKQAQTQTLISTRELIKITAGTKAAASTQKQQEQLGISATVTSSEQSNRVSIHFAGIEYDVTTQVPKEPWMATDFARFSDMAARLNLLRRQGLPPFARMTLGDHLARRGLMPHHTQLKIRKNGKTQRYHSEAVMGGMTDADRAAIKNTQGFAGLFKQVPLDQLQ